MYMYILYLLWLCFLGIVNKKGLFRDVNHHILELHLKFEDKPDVGWKGALNCFSPEHED